MAQVNRVHGTAQAGAFYGLQPRYFTITQNGAFVAGERGTEGKFEKAVRGVNTVASIVILGAPSDNAFTVVVDDSFGGRGSDDAAATLKAAVEGQIGGTVTVAEVALVGAGLA